MIFEFSETTDWLSEVGEGITQITKIEPVTYNGKQLAKIEFTTERGIGSGLYREDTSPLAQLCRACGFPAKKGDRVDSNLLIGKKFWGVWGARVGGRDGYIYADLVSAHPIPADAVDWRPVSAKRWTDMGRDTDGVKLADKKKQSETKPASPFTDSDDDLPF